MNLTLFLADPAVFLQIFCSNKLKKILMKKVFWSFFKSFTRQKVYCLYQHKDAWDNKLTNLKCIICSPISFWIFILTMKTLPRDSAIIKVKKMKFYIFNYKIIDTFNMNLIISPWWKNSSSNKQNFRGQNDNNSTLLLCRCETSGWVTYLKFSTSTI